MWECKNFDWFWQIPTQNSVRFGSYASIREHIQLQK